MKNESAEIYFSMPDLIIISYVAVLIILIHKQGPKQIIENYSDNFHIKDKNKSSLHWIISLANSSFSHNRFNGL